ncbi:MAG: hypothetical protein WC980_01660 [Candidatus Brocadiia bacterium]
MKGLWKMGVTALCSTVVLMGCASKGFVQEEISKARTELINGYTKSVDESYAKLSSELKKSIVDIQTNYALKNFVEGENYKVKQELLKEVDSRIETVKKLSEDLRTTLDSLKMSGESGLENLAKYLRASANVITKQLQAQKEGLEQAIDELGKMELGKDTGTTPPPNPEAPK